MVVEVVVGVVFFSGILLLYNTVPILTVRERFGKTAALVCFITLATGFATLCLFAILHNLLDFYGVYVFLITAPTFAAAFIKEKMLQTLLKAGLCFLISLGMYIWILAKFSLAFSFGFVGTPFFLLHYFMMFYVFARGKKGFYVGLTCSIMSFLVLWVGAIIINDINNYTIGIMFIDLIMLFGFSLYLLLKIENKLALQDEE